MPTSWANPCSRGQVRHGFGRVTIYGGGGGKVAHSPTHSPPSHLGQGSQVCWAEDNSIGLLYCPHLFIVF